MNTKKEQSIQDFTDSFNKMANLVLGQLKLLEKLMTITEKEELDELITKLKKCEKVIDNYEISISDKFINIIVLYQPMASDIRKLVAVYRMMINLERVGDLIVNIAYTMDKLRDTDEYNAMSEVILNMLMSGKIMVEKSLLSFVNDDTDYAIWTIKNDSIVDEMNNKLLKNSISKAKINDKTKEMLLSYTNLKNVITNIERIADHATNIAEASIYSLQGTDVRHSRLDKNNKQKKSK